MAKYAVVDPLVAEVMTVLKAIIFCKEMRFFDVIFEGVIADTSHNFSRIDHFVDSSRIEMRFLRCAYVVHVSQLYNDAAHILAKEASCYSLDTVWLKDIPRCIAKIVLRKQCNP